MDNEKEFLDKVQWHLAEVVNLVRDFGTNGIDYQLLYKNTDDIFWDINLKLDVVKEDIDVDAWEEKYRQSAAVHKLVHPDRKATLIKQDKKKKK